MVLHLRRHTGDQCEYKTGKSHDHKFHKINPAEEKQLHSGDSEFKTISLKSLSQHKKHHSKLPCDQSEFMTDHPMYLSSHKRREHHGYLQPTLEVDEPVDCIYCGKKCKSKKHLEKHMERIHCGFDSELSLM